MIGPGPDRAGGVSSVITAYRDAGLFVRWNVEVVETHVDGSALSKLARALRALAQYVGALAAGRIALAHVHVASNASLWRKLPFCALTRLAGLPLIVHVHGGGFAEFYRRGGRLRRAAIRWCLRQASVVTALSPRWARRLEAIEPSQRVQVLPNPLPAASPALRCAGDAPHLVFLGSVGVAKGVDDLIDAFAQVVQTHPTTLLTIAGRGDLERARGRAASLGVAERVALPGWTHGEAKATLLAGATVFVLPSHAEGVPISILEAQGAGVPVVATRVGGVPDLIDHGVHGWLVPARDPQALAAALIKLIEQPALRDALAHAGRERAVRDHAQEHVVAQVEALYRLWLASERTNAGPSPSRS